MCENWRGLTLVPLTSRIFCRIILARVSRIVESKMLKEQAGFKKSKSCIVKILTLRQIRNRILPSMHYSLIMRKFSTAQTVRAFGNFVGMAFRARLLMLSKSQMKDSNAQYMMEIISQTPWKFTQGLNKDVFCLHCISTQQWTC